MSRHHHHHKGIFVLTIELFATLLAQAVVLTFCALRWLVRMASRRLSERHRRRFVPSPVSSHPRPSQGFSGPYSAPNLDYSNDTIRDIKEQLVRDNETVHF